MKDTTHTETEDEVESTEELSSTDPEAQTTGSDSSRRRVLQVIGGAAATVAFMNAASADEDDENEADDEDIEYNPNDDQRPEGPLGNGRGLSYSRFHDQVTSGGYVIVDEVNITTEEGGFMSVHIARPEEGIADVGFIDAETGEPQNAAETIIGYSEFLEQGVHQNVRVPLFDDEDLEAVSGEFDQLPDATVLVSLPHIDSNENEEWDFFEEGDEDPAYGFDGVGAPTDGSFAPPGPNRPTDIAAVVPLEENAEDFHIFRAEDEFHDGQMDSDGKVDDDDDDKDD